YITGDAFAATSLTLSDFYATQNSDQNVGQSSPILDVAQSFRAGFTGQIGQVSLYLKKTGSPADKTVRIMGDSGGNPNKNNVLASGTLSSSLVTGSYGWINITFTSPANVINNANYWIMTDSSANSNNYYVWGIDSGGGFSDGAAKYSSNWSAGSPVWTAITGDLNFKIWQGGINFINGIAVYGDARANTITNSKVCGNAYYQTIDGSSLTFVNSPGSPCPTPYTLGTAYPGSSDPVPQNMPISDSNIQEWREQAEAGGVFSDSAHCAPANGVIIGPARLNCDFTVQNGKTITIKAPVWVKGNILLDTNVVVVLDASYGALSGIVMADDLANQTTVGTIRVRNNVAICGSAGYNSGNGECNPSNGSYLMFLSTYSGSGEAIALENNVKGEIFYASAGTAKIENNAEVKEIIAYKLDVENNAHVVYEQGLANAQFSSGPGASYEILEWKETE
ncbi:MAG: choice-of-anchor R domain-containing protein, partial [Patescibacteria group bacterium]